MKYEISDTNRNEAAFWNFKTNQINGFERAFVIALKNAKNNAGELNASIINPNKCSEYAIRLTNQLKNVFLPKIAKWMKYEHVQQNSTAYSVESISLINLQEYNQLYNDLKIRYGEHMTKVIYIFQSTLSFLHFQTKFPNCICRFGQRKLIHRNLSTKMLESQLIYCFYGVTSVKKKISISCNRLLISVVEMDY